MTDVASPNAPEARRLSRYAARKTSSARHVARHSQAIRWLRWIAPAAALAIAGTVILWPTIWTDIQRAVSLLPILVNTDARGFHVVSLTMRGVDDDNQPYMITAETATKFDPDAKEIELASTNIDITTQNGEWMYVSGDSGVYRNDEDVLELYDNVTFYHDNGYEFYMHSAIVDIGEGTAESFEEVQGQGDFGTITSNGITVLERGDVIIFRGPVVLRTHDDALNDAAEVSR